MCVCVCVSVCVQSCPTFATPWDCSPPGSLPMEFPGKNTGLGLPFPIPRDSLNPEIEPVSLVSSALADE